MSENSEEGRINLMVNYLRKYTNSTSGVCCMLMEKYKSNVFIRLMGKLGLDN